MVRYVAMKQRARWTTIVVGVVAGALGACKAKPTSPNAAALARAEQFKAEVCACKDSACVTAANVAVDAWKAKQPDPGAKPTDAEMKAMTEILRGVKACADKLPNTAIAETTAMLTKLADEMCACADKPCADRVQTEMKTWSSAMQAKAEQNGQPTEAQMAAMQASGTKLGRCFSKFAIPVGGTTTTVALPPALGPNVPATCTEYRAAVTKYLACDAVPQATRDAMSSAYGTMASSWGNLAGATAAQQATVADGCTVGLKALQTSAASAGCTP